MCPSDCMAVICDFLYTAAAVNPNTAVDKQCCGGGGCCNAVSDGTQVVHRRHRMVLSAVCTRELADGQAR